MYTEEKNSEKLKEYHYNAYKNLIKIAVFLNSAGITAVMATLGLKHNPEDSGMAFINPKSDFDATLYSSLDFFLLSLLMIVICVVIEYLSYWPRRRQEKCLTNSKCWRDYEIIINICVFTMLAALLFSYILLIFGGLEFDVISLS